MKQHRLEFLSLLLGVALLVFSISLFYPTQAARAIDNSRNVQCYDAFRTITTVIGASGASTSQVFDLHDLQPNGFFSVQITTVGASSETKLEYQMSADNETWSTPSGSTPILTGFTAGSGFYDFDPEVGRYMRLVATEIAGTAVSGITVFLCIQ